MTATLDTFTELDRKLIAGGQYGLPEFWMGQGERIYAGPANTFVGQVGRGGIKSGFGTRVAENEVFFGDFPVPAGEIHYWVDVSENKDEARQRLLQYQEHARILGIPTERRGDEVIVPHLRRGFMARAFDTGRVAGFRAIGWRADELAKAAPNLEDGREVVGSLAAMTITHASHRPKGLLLSAPVGKRDYHFHRYALGDTDFQIVVNAPTWVANPSITEEQTRAAEPHTPTWLMEYAAIANDGILGGFFNEPSLARSRDLAPLTKIIPDAHYVVAVDPAFSRDKFGWAVLSSLRGDYDPETGKRERSRITRVHETGAWAPDGSSPREMARRLMTDVCRRYHTKQAYTDQHEGKSWAELARDVGLGVFVVPWTGGDGDTSKTTRYRAVRTAMLEGSFLVPDDPSLMHEFRTVQSEFTPTGFERVFTPRNRDGHGDRVSAIVLGGSICLGRQPELPPSRKNWMDVLIDEQRDAQMRIFASMF